MTLKIIDNEQPEQSKIQIIKLSASSIKTYKDCPRKYFYSYIERLPQKEHDYFELGNLCHRTLELFHDLYKEGSTKFDTLNKLMSHCFTEAKKEGKKLTPQIIEDAKGMLMDYLKSVINKVPEVKETEQAFDFMINEDIRIRGFIDRVDLQPDGTLQVVDYKTTKDPKYLDPMQLLIYGLALRNQYPEMTRYKASYVLLKHKSKFMDFNFGLADLQKVEAEIIKYGETIRNENEWQPIPTRLCNWCDFKDVCPSQQRGSW